MSGYQDVIVAGFGGQGVMLIGTLLAYAAMEDGQNVTYLPVYGPEMRGGTANCTVVVSREDIGSPIIRLPKSLIAMNRPSLDKFQPRVKDGGTVVINSSLVDMDLADNDRLRTVGVPANEIADSLGNTKMANMVAIGAYVQLTSVVPLEVIKASLRKVISPNYAKMIPANEKAIHAGADAVRG
ncbi:MAG: 2-oxoacid:ferredoxin oxidoreductase subunit gamma [Desulfovibrionales bacterium]|nr:MAG: 2-oxoacid:ferredoxin oxidoreductase subunit gamma [Desulfovibrionales bacterium]